MEHTALTPLSCSYYPTIQLLVDENLNIKDLSLLTERGIPLLSLTEVMPKKSPDEDVVRYMVANRHALITMDSDFLHFKKFDFTPFYGVVHLPQNLGVPSRKQVIEIALNHFSDIVAPFMASRRGVVVRYNIEGDYKVMVPEPSSPRRPKEVARGSYAQDGQKFYS